MSQNIETIQSVNTYTTNLAIQNKHQLFCKNLKISSDWLLYNFNATVSDILK